MSVNPYHTSYIYKIVNDNNSLFYVGSTYQSLTTRMIVHKSVYKRYINNISTKWNSAFLILSDDTSRIELLESVKCENKIELLKKEREYFDKFRNTIVNIIRPYVNDGEIKERVKKSNTNRNFKFITCDTCDRLIKVRNKKEHSTSKEHLNNLR